MVRTLSGLSDEQPFTHDRWKGRCGLAEIVRPTDRSMRSEYPNCTEVPGLGRQSLLAAPEVADLRDDLTPGPPGGDLF